MRQCYRWRPTHQHSKSIVVQRPLFLPTTLTVSLHPSLSMMCPAMAALRYPRDPSATGVPLRSKTRRRARGLFIGVSVDVIIVSCMRASKRRDRVRLGSAKQDGGQSTTSRLDLLSYYSRSQHLCWYWKTSRRQISTTDLDAMPATMPENCRACASDVWR